MTYAAGMAANNELKWLIFVDTNVFLDFYRLNGDTVKNQFDGLQKHLGSLIVTEQVRMEYLKNRQKIILDRLGALSKPNGDKVPMVLGDTKPARAYDTSVKRAEQAHARLRKRLVQMLQDPSRYDPVYKRLIKIFASNECLNLKRPDKRRFSIRKMALKRFMLGYPPRKTSDTSIIDAINWEWIIYCAQQQPANCGVLIVSRDNDFGTSHDKKSFINDWLRAEFKERTRLRNQIELSGRLSDALKKLREPVPPADEEAEGVVISLRPDPTNIGVALSEPSIAGI